MSSNQFDQRILQLVNEERTETGLDPLAIDNQLDRAAELHTDEMVQADRMSHQLPGEAGLGDRVSATGFDWTRLAENVAAGYTTPEAVVDAWMNSPGHRRNILNADFTSLGVGYEEASDDAPGDTDVYWTQVFGAGTKAPDFQNSLQDDNASKLQSNPDSNPANNNASPTKVDNFVLDTQNNSPDQNSTNYDQKILQLVNQERTEAGLDPLAIDNQLDRAAELHTDEMVQADRMSHQLPGEAGLGDRVSATGFDWTRLGENVAAGHTTPEAVVDAWMNSPGHRRNILNADFTSLGVGYEEASDNISGDTDVYWTQVFAADSFNA